MYYNMCFLQLCNHFATTLGTPSITKDCTEKNNLSTLPSNASLDYYPDNTITCYVTKLQRIALKSSQCKIPIVITGVWD